MFFLGGSTVSRCAPLLTAWLLVSVASGRAESLSQRLLEDAADGRLETLDFASAALVASGVEKQPELQAWLDLYRLRRSEILAAVRLDDGEPLAKAIHAELHERILTGSYQTEATDLRLTLADGDFNCLSSLALYYDLCQVAGIEAEIWLRRGHVYLRLPGDGVKAVLEPGARRWVLQFDNPHGSTDRQLTPVALLGKFYYNRGVELLEQGRFAAGLALVEIGIQLDPHDQDARSNLVAGLNNWAVAQFRSRRYDEAERLITRGLALDGAFAPLVANERLLRVVLGK
jgi:hypothetical protein